MRSAPGAMVISQYVGGMSAEGGQRREGADDVGCAAASLGQIGEGCEIKGSKDGLEEFGG